MQMHVDPRCMLDARYKHVQGTEGDPDSVRTTYYVGSVYERVVAANGATTHRFHIFAGGAAVAVYSCTTSCGSDPNGNAADGTRDETLYFHKDHLSSINVITDGHGVEQQRFNYTAGACSRPGAAPTAGSRTKSRRRTPSRPAGSPATRC